ncbi:MAG: flagellin [Pseudomonadota bacterium]
MPTAKGKDDMASILTNTSAMVALQTLRSTNSSLEAVQSQISTGKEVASAKDNAAVFAISQVMDSDVSGFQAISDSLSLGSSTVAVASNASASIGEALKEIKTKIISANEDNVDQQKLQDEISSLVAQVEGVVSAAQFNGLNLIDGTAGTSVSVLASLDRDNAGNVTANNITVDLTNTNLSTTAGAAVAGVFDTGQAGVNGAASGFSAAIDESGGTTDALDIAFDSAVAPTAGNVYTLSVGETEFTYTAQTGDDNLAVAYNLRDQIQGSGLSVTASVTPVADPTATDVVLNIQNDDTTAGLTISGEAVSAGAGALAGLSSIDVTSDAAGALTEIEGMIDSVIDAQATFGTAEKRLELQNDFMSTLIDSFKSGIGSLVDADLEEASARLQALQVQQQLGIQALSIANQAPQSVLSLFR